MKVEKVKILIEVSGGTIQAVHSNSEVNFVIVDYDNINNGESPVSGVFVPDSRRNNLYEAFSGSTPTENEIYEELKRLKF